MSKSKDKSKNKKWELSRRDFLKVTGAGTAGGTLLNWTLVGPNPAAAATADTVIRNICPYCSVSCGIKVAVDSGTNTVVDIYGDEDNVLNNGRLCSKGNALLQLQNSNQRELEPKIKYNGVWYKNSTSGATGWSEILSTSGTINLANWEDENTGTPGSGTIDSVPRALGLARQSDPDSVAFWGSSHLTNEECYLYRKLITIFGTNNIEHQARI